MRRNTENMIQRLILIASLVLIISSVFAQQKGSIKGKVKDVSTSEDIPFANVVLEGANMGTSTDMEGNFILQNIPVGSYTLSVTYVSYKKKVVDSVQVQSNKVLVVEIGLEPDAETLGEVVISEARETFSEVAVMSEIKLSKQVIVGISAEQMSRSQDNTAAQAMSRIPGVTITDGRFVMIRGVNQRYNAVQLNGANAPSTEIDSRAFSFDLIPTGLIDRMLINKSGSPEYPGDFAGGVIRIFTKNVPDENFMALSVGFGYRTGTTGQEGFRTKRSSTDWLGYDNKDRVLPSDFPANVEPLDKAGKGNAARQLSSDFLPTSYTVSPDYKVGFTIGRNMFAGGVKIATINSLNYSTSFQNIEYDRFRYQERGQGATITPIRYNYNDRFSSQDVRISAMSNWSFALNSKNRIEFRNSFNQLGETETVIREGTDIVQLADFDQRNYSSRYLSRSIYSGQLNGNHKLVPNQITLDWTLGFTSLSRNEPDFRRVRTIRNKSEAGTNSPYLIQLAPNTSPSEAGRFYSNLWENSIFQGTNLEYKLKKTADENVPLIRFGYNFDRRNRTFRARYLNYNVDNVTADRLDSLRTLPLDQAFGSANVGPNGFLLREGTSPAEKYTASNTLIAAYVGASIPLGKLDVSGGVRIENNNQELLGFNRSGQVANGGQNLTSPLFFANFTYDFTETILGRLAYNRTINRPEFRELASFSFYDFVIDANFAGNPNLKVCDINNFDGRLEWYPNVGEIISIGGFYKQFNNPIEVTIENAGELQFTYGNAKSATAAGVELEIKKSLESLATGNRIFKNLTFTLNAALIRSLVTFDTIAKAPDGTLAQDKERPLQGQSPYVVNAGLTYNDQQSKTMVNLSYNIFGPRIFAVGNRNFPTVWELPRHSIDLSVSKEVAKNVELKFGIQDLLNYQYRFYQDTNLDGKVNESDKGDPIFTYRKGTAFSFGATIKF